jgi:hypothetical protein
VLIGKIEMQQRKTQAEMPKMPISLGLKEDILTISTDDQRITSVALQTTPTKRRWKIPIMRSKDFFMGMICNKNKMDNASQRTSLIIYHQNIRSIRNKKELGIFLNDVCYNSDILCISEHHLSISYIFSMAKCKMATGFSHKWYKNGGVCILVKENVSYQELDLNNLSMKRVLKLVL